MEQAQAALQTLTLQGLSAIAQSSFGIAGCKGGIAYYDTRKDDLVTTHASFEPAVEALARIPAVQTFFGAVEAKRLAIQFVFNACRWVSDGVPADAAIEQVWAAFVQELSTPTWTFAGVANVQNIECSENIINLFDGISVRGRSFEELSALLNWGPPQLDYLVKDWMEGAMSSFVLFVQKQVQKTPDNFLFTDDGTAYTRAARALLAMRLHAPGDVRFGRLFFTKPTAFNVGIGGMQSSGFSVWHPGLIYRLTSEEVPQITQLYESLCDLEARADKTNRNLVLALRSFSSIYDRSFHQAEDRILDAVTTLEALWKLDVELNFRLAFRTATLLAVSDDERVSIYEILCQYYRIRSKVVHGGSLSELQTQQLREDEPLRNLVRRALRAFLCLAINPGEWTLKRLYDEGDCVLLHTSKRKALQAAMGIAS